MIDKIQRDIICKTLKQLKYFNVPVPAKILDVGSGKGELIKEMSKAIRCETYACDCTAELMELEDQAVDIVDLNKEHLPYENSCFDVVVCTEVLEHLENFRSLLRDVHRVLRDDGVAVFTTPNILNLKSRVRFLFSGFGNLFGPLLCGDRESHTLQGHITPISYFYLAHSLAEIGFNKIRMDIGKLNKSSCALFPVLYLPIFVFSKSIFRKVNRRYQSINSSNREFVRQINGWKVLLGRTVIVAGSKKPSA